MHAGEDATRGLFGRRGLIRRLYLPSAPAVGDEPGSVT